MECYIMFYWNFTRTPTCNDEIDIFALFSVSLLTTMENIQYNVSITTSVTFSNKLIHYF